MTGSVHLVAGSAPIAFERSPFDGMRLMVDGTLCTVGVICAAPALDGAWWRAQVITFYKENNEVEIRYVDYGGYDRVKIDTLRQIRCVCQTFSGLLTDINILLL